MKKLHKKHLESEEDEKVESRMELKDKLGFVSSSFNLSGMTQSYNENNKLNHFFPHINEPTLELKDTQNSHSLKLGQDELQRYYPEGLTARNNYTDKSMNRVNDLEEQIQQLHKQIDLKNEEVTKQKIKNSALQKEVEKLKKQLKKKNEQLERQEKQLSQIKLKQSLSHSSESQSRRNSSNNTSLMQESIQNFCPQLLSPEETVLLLNKLLKKVSKSSKMITSLTNDNTTKEILAKIQTN